VGPDRRIEGREATATRSVLLDVLAARRDSFFVARRSLRDLVTDFRARVFEATIHASRMRAMVDAHEVGHLPIDGNRPDICYPMPSRVWAKRSTESFRCGTGDTVVPVLGPAGSTFTGALFAMDAGWTAR
jgi:hypothetical protein